MRLVRIGVGALSVKVGDFDGNRAHLEALIGRAQSEAVHLLVTPERVLNVLEIITAARRSREAGRPARSPTAFYVSRAAIAGPWTAAIHGSARRSMAPCAPCLSGASA